MRLLLSCLLIAAAPGIARSADPPGRCRLEAAGAPASPQPDLRLLRPVAGVSASVPFGCQMHPLLGDNRQHDGIDFAAAMGTAVRASAAGRVRTAARQGSNGNLVVLAHAGDHETRYAHLLRFVVGEGESVQRGQLIGYVGATGLAAGPHLHFELRTHSGRVIDPAPLLVDQ